MKYLMACGHVGNAVDENKNPVCAICDGIKSGARVAIRECVGNEGLEGRIAKCVDCGKFTESKWNLAFFEYRPDAVYDYFYNGCKGWS